MTGTNFRKSAFSFANGNCVEVGEDCMNNGNCIEAGTSPGSILVRDTADRPGPVIAFTAEAWARFTPEAGR